MSDRASFIVAVSAAALAAGAFIIVSLQAILEYLSSGPRHKCTYAAIGHTSKQVKIRWSFLQWRLRVQYPLLDLNWVDIMDLVQKESLLQDIDAHYAMRKLKETHNDWSWTPVEIGDKLTPFHVADDLTVLRGLFKEHQYGRDDITTRPITIKDLSFKEKSIFLYYRLWHSLRPLERPRASWAQLLVAIGVRDTKKLRLRMVDADTVPSALDAPIQRVKLRSLGFLAHILGFTKVTIDVAERRFLALCPRGTISTIEVSTLGKVLRFEGDIMAIHGLVCRAQTFEIYRAAYLVKGKISCGKYLANGLFLPLETLAQAINEKWSSSKWNIEMQQAVLKNSRKFFIGPIAREARIMDILIRKWSKSKQGLADSQEHLVELNHTEDVYHEYDNKRLGERLATGYEHLAFAAKWQLKTKLSIPTIYISATFQTIHSVICGFPSMLLIQPFLPWLASRAKKLYERRGQAFHCSLALTDAMGAGTLKFSRDSSDYLMSTGGGSLGGLFGWGIMNMVDIFNGCPAIVQKELAVDFNLANPQAIVTVETCNLLKHFDPQKWASSVREAQREAATTFNPINVLWAQINLLDVAIQLQIRSDWDYGKTAETFKDNTRESQSADDNPMKTYNMVAEVETTNNSKSKLPNEPVHNQPPTDSGPPSNPHPTIVNISQSTKTPIDLQELKKQGTPSVTFLEPGPKWQAVSGPQQASEAEKSQGHQSSPPKDILRTENLPESEAQPKNSSTLQQSTKPNEISQMKSPRPALSRLNSNDVPLVPLERQPSIMPEDHLDGDTVDSALFAEEYQSIEARVVSAIVKSWRPQTDVSIPSSPIDVTLDDNDDEDFDSSHSSPATEPQEWQLASALRTHSGLTFGTDDEELRKAKFDKLADLLELRALFVIALLTLHPDSSDTYSIEEEDIEMPMA